MTPTEHKSYHRGKEARLHGQDRIITHARLTRANRQAWYTGWDDQDRHMQPTPTPEQTADIQAGLSHIREFLAGRNASREGRRGEDADNQK